MSHLEAMATVRWKGYGGSVEGASGALHAETATQAELGGPGSGTNPEELMAAAHANCFTSTLTSLARARGVDLDSVETQATTRLVWGEGRDHHLASSRLSLRIRSRSPEADVRRIVREAEEECPVCQAIRGNVAMTVDLEIGPPAGVVP
jgi:organic hydroperoxide reductase OsmC/OhrA